MLNDIHSAKAEVREGKVVLTLRAAGESSVAHVFHLSASLALAVSGQLETAAQKLIPPAPQPMRIDS